MNTLRATALTLLFAALPSAAFAQDAQPADAPADDTGAAAAGTAEPQAQGEAKAEVSTGTVSGPKVAEQPAPEPAPDVDKKKAAHGESGCGKSSLGDNNGYHLAVCGYVALNVMHDSTQSFRQSIANNMIARRGTYAGDHRQLQFTAKDSRITIEVGTPTMGGIKPSGMVQFDFNGATPAETNEGDYYVGGLMRMRHAYLKLETPVVDVLAGQYHDLFGWGGAGFYPATIAFLGITGQVYHRQPQLRLSKTLDGEAVDLEVALAAMRPVHKASGVPDGEAGVRLAVDGWRGAATQAYGQPAIVPLGVGVSGIVRSFAPPEFKERPMEPEHAVGWGAVANAVIPVIPADSNDDRGNALTLTGEFSVTGIADMYTELTGGVLFPQLNDPGRPVPPIYPANIDSGIITIGGNGEPETVDWRAFVIVPRLPADCQRQDLGGRYQNWRIRVRQHPGRHPHTQPGQRLHQVRVHRRQLVRGADGKRAGRRWAPKPSSRPSVTASKRATTEPSSACSCSSEAYRPRSTHASTSFPAQVRKLIGPSGCHRSRS